MDKTNIGLYYIHVSPISIPSIPILSLLWIHLYSVYYTIVDPFPQHYVVFMAEAEMLATIFPRIPSIMCNQ